MAVGLRPTAIRDSGHPLGLGIEDRQVTPRPAVGARPAGTLRWSAWPPPLGLLPRG